MKQAVHDNINSFVGVSIDRSSDFYVIWKHCLRGTLSDVIKNNGKGNNPKFDRDFKGAFVRDVIKVKCFIE
jgi:guanylate cyclase